MESFERQWYVLHTYSGYENKGKQNIESRALSMKMEDLIFRVVVTEETIEEERNGKMKPVKVNNFPGYVLVEMIMTDESWYVVRNTPGVTGFVGSHGAGSKPAPLLPEEVTSILKSIGMSVRTTQLDVSVGDVMKIIEGAFAGKTGEVTAIDHKNEKLTINVEFFGRETPTELDFDQVDHIIE